MSASDRLFFSVRSPFARRVRLAYQRLDLKFESAVVNVFEPTTEMIQANPLGQVPILETRFGTLADSWVILEYLHEQHGAHIWPSDAKTRFAVKGAAVLAEGLMTYSVMHFLKQSPEDAVEVLQRTLARLEAIAPTGVLIDASRKLTQAGWDTGVALEYIDLRQPFLDWRKSYPGLVGVLEACRRFPTWAESTPPPQ